MPRITPSSVQEHREQVQRRVFEAFATLMAQESFDAITMAKLAAEERIGRTAIYHHFTDKEEVLVAFASHETRRNIDGLRAAPAARFLTDCQDRSDSLSSRFLDAWSRACR